MAVATGQTTTRRAEADANFNTLCVSARPPGPRGYSFAVAGSGVTSNTTIQALLALHNPSALMAIVIRYMKFQFTTDAAASPAAALAVGADLFVARHWVQAATAFAGGTFVMRRTPPKRTTRLARTYSAPPSGSVANPAFLYASATGDAVGASDQFTRDSHPFLSVRAWDLIQAAAVPKQRFEMEFNARDSGTYPLVLEQLEGIHLFPAANNFASIETTFHIEWDEIPYEDLDGIL